MVAGVAAGLAEHLRVDVTLVRLAFALLTFAGGMGAALYAAFWAVVPEPDGRRVSLRHPDSGLLALGALAVAAVVVTQAVGLGPGLVWPMVVVAGGTALIWRQADEGRRARWRARSTSRAAQLGAGVALIVGGLIAFLAAQGALAQARGALLPIAVVLAGAALVTGPWLLRLGRQLSDERRARIREEERAEVAAHLHDSVLQTLTLIRRRAGDAEAVARLARSSERDLRRWLYAPGERAEATLATALRASAADVEDDHGVSVEAVTVGDTPLTERVTALLDATREALVNAAKSSGADEISLYAEVSGSDAAVFVRDRGRGFDPAAVPDDRYGIRESIVGRMRRNGGTAEVRSALGAGTEVRLALPLTEGDAP